MDFSFRRLISDDAEAYRQIRLDMLLEIPQAFGDSYEEVVERPLSTWKEYISGDRAFFGAFSGDALVGTNNFLREKPRKMAHRGWLMGMYVRPEARGTSCAMGLIDTLIDYARDDVIQVHLGVGAFNTKARRLYEKAGFELYGTEPRSLFVNNEYFDEHFMIRMLDKDT